MRRANAAGHAQPRRGVVNSDDGAFPGHDFPHVLLADGQLPPQPTVVSQLDGSHGVQKQGWPYSIADKPTRFCKRRDSPQRGGGIVASHCVCAVGTREEVRFYLHRRVGLTNAKTQWSVRLRGTRSAVTFCWEIHGSDRARYAGRRANAHLRARQGSGPEIRLCFGISPVERRGRSLNPPNPTPG